MDKVPVTHSKKTNSKKDSKSSVSKKKKPKNKLGPIFSFLILGLIVVGVVLFQAPLLNFASSLWNINNSSDSALQTAASTSPTTTSSANKRSDGTTNTGITTPSSSDSPSKGVELGNDLATKDTAGLLPVSSTTAPIKTINKEISQASTIAKSFAKMPPSKAADIFETQMNDEIVYEMAMMSEVERAHIWSKMTPRKVADLSLLLKKKSEWTEPELAQLKLNAESAKRLVVSSTEELASSYSKMRPTSAAKLIDRMLQTDKSKTLSVVKAMDNNARTTILTVMAEDKALMGSATQIIKALEQ
ncbi:hypothetical protein [Paenibacillus illinoisensis]|uniref:hypothetical protein n=1 Tax=Paenibacillus illinoisensis TaxID=59845 RepID=UPI00301DAB80